MIPVFHQIVSLHMCGGILRGLDCPILGGCKAFGVEDQFTRGRGKIVDIFRTFLEQKENPHAVAGVKEGSNETASGRGAPLAFTD
jgi:hypothetical protein